MKRRFAWITGVFVCYAVTVMAGTAVFGFEPRTGDGSLDRYLKSLNAEAEMNMNGFVVSLSTHFGVTELQVTMVLRKVEQPADAYLCFRMARIIDRPVDVVVREYQANRGRGWGVIAKNLGIKPGSKEFHALKKSDFSPGKGKGKGKGHGKAKGHKK